MIADHEPQTPWADRMESHLHAAVTRHQEPNPAPVVDIESRRRNHYRPFAMAAVAAAVVVAALSLSVIRPTTSQAFTIERLVDGSTLITVNDLVVNPDATRERLFDHGIPSTVEGIPVTPTLVGDIVLVYADDTVETTYDGPKIVSILVPANYVGPLELGYGRAAETGETYMFTQAGDECANVAGRRVADALKDLRAIAPNIRWKHYATDTFALSEIDEPDLNAFVVDIIPLTSDSMIVTTYDQPDVVTPSSPFCTPNN